MIRNVPLAVWDYFIGGFPVLRKWLSYRDTALIGRPLTDVEVRELANIVRRITMLLLLQPQLDANYLAVSRATFPWQAVGYLNALPGK